MSLFPSILQITTPPNRLRFMALALVFSIPLSTALTNVLLLFYFLTWASCYKHYSLQRSNLFIWFYQPITISLLIILSCYIIGIYYSPSTFSGSIQTLKHQARFLVIPLLIPAFLDKKTRLLAINLFVIAVSFSIIVSYIQIFYKHHDAYTLPSFFAYNAKGFFKDAIFTSLFLAFSIYYFIIRLLTEQNLSKYKKIFIITLLVLFTHYLYFITTGRTGQIIAILLISMLFITYTNKKIALASVLCLSLLIVLIFNTTSTFSIRMKDASTEVTQYIKSIKQEEPIPGEEAVDVLNTSLGLRMELAINSIQLFLEKPFLGWGTNSFAIAYNQKFPPHRQMGQLKNPHNQYLLILVELGIVGIFTYIILFYSLTKLRKKMPSFERKMLDGLLLSIITGCIVNSWLRDFTSLIYFVALASILIASAFEKQPGDKTITS